MHRFAHEAMTTTFEAIIIHPDKKYAGQAAAAVFAEIDRLERLLSRHDPGTDLAQINRLRPGEYLPVAQEVVECLEIAANAYIATNGAFDPAYRSTQNGTRPSAMERLILSRPDNDAPATPQQFLAGINKVEEASRKVEEASRLLPDQPQPYPQTNPRPLDDLPPHSANLDLGAIGKGYALDKALIILDDWDIDNALLNSGTSTVLARGPGPKTDAENSKQSSTPPPPPVPSNPPVPSDPPVQNTSRHLGHLSHSNSAPIGWPVGISGDYADITGLDKTHLVNCALSGSGTAIKGQHIRNPDTGAPAPALAAWAKTKTAAQSDAISTALMTMAKSEARKFCQDNPDIAAIVIYPGEKTADALIAGDW